MPFSLLVDSCPRTLLARSGKPIKEGNVTVMTRLPEYRLQLKLYIEKTMISATIEHEGPDFLRSLQTGGPQFICDLYNDV